MDSESDSQDHTAEAPPRVRIPDHGVVKRIGRGRYGDVYLGRSVAGQLLQREFSGTKRFEPIYRSHPRVAEILRIGRGPELDLGRTAAPARDGGPPWTPPRKRPRARGDF